MTNKPFLKPEAVNKAANDLLMETDEPISLQDIVTKLTGQGMVNPITRKGPSRMAVLKVLRDRRNADGPGLLEKMKARRDGRYATTQG